MPDA
jgi:hypothetical protein